MIETNANVNATATAKKIEFVDRKVKKFSFAAMQRIASKLISQTKYGTVSTAGTFPVLSIAQIDQVVKKESKLKQKITERLGLLNKNKQHTSS